MLKSRRDEYENQFIAEEADQRLEELNKRMANLKNELSEIKAKAQKEAQAEAARIVEQGRVLAEHIKDEAKRVAEAELEKAQKALNSQVFELVHSKVSEKLQNELGKEEHNRFIASQVNTLAGLASRSQS